LNKYIKNNASKNLLMPEARHQFPTPAPSLTGSRDERYTSAVLMALRAATQNQHAIVDSSMPLSDPDAAWPDYVDHLHMLAAWLSPVEKWLLNFRDGPQGKGAPIFICYSDIIIADLGNAFKPADEQWQNDSPLFVTDDAAYRWGVCYVIEGSQLGGEFLYKRLATRLAPHP